MRLFDFKNPKIYTMMLMKRIRAVQILMVMRDLREVALSVVVLVVVVEVDRADGRTAGGRRKKLVAKNDGGKDNCSTRTRIRIRIVY